MTNDYEHLLISLAFIIVKGKPGACLLPHCVWDGIVKEEADRELSLSVGG